MTFRELDNRCAEVADKMAELGEKTVYAIIIIATAFGLMIMTAEAQSWPNNQPTKQYKVEQHYNVFTGQFESKLVEDRGLWGTGYSDITTTETKTNPFNGKKYLESTTQTVPNDALGQPIKPLPDVLDIFNQ